MDPDSELEWDLSPLIRRYKSGRIERLRASVTVPAGTDPVTGVISKDIIAGNISLSARLYLPSNNDSNKKLPILVYFHGGGFCIESASSPTYQSFLNKLSSKAGLLVVSVDYRLAPEHVLPAAYDDAWVAIKWVFSDGADEWVREYGDLGRVFVAGDSAGGNIAHQIALRSYADDDVKLEGMVLIHPYFWGTQPIGSQIIDPRLGAWMEGLWKTVSPPEAGSLDHPWSNPMVKDAPSLKGLGCKRLMICVAEKDVLTERGKAYGAAVKESGWDGEEVVVVESVGKNHVFHLLEPECHEASELMQKLVAFFTKSNE